LSFDVLDELDRRGIPYELHTMEERVAADYQDLAQAIVLGMSRPQPH
jgi:hypothetical protein